MMLLLPLALALSCLLSSAYSYGSYRSYGYGSGGYSPSYGGYGGYNNGYGSYNNGYSGYNNGYGGNSGYNGYGGSTPYYGGGSPSYYGGGSSSYYGGGSYIGSGYSTGGYSPYYSPARAGRRYKRSAQSDSQIDYAVRRLMDSVRLNSAAKNSPIYPDYNNNNNYNNGGQFIPGLPNPYPYPRYPSYPSTGSGSGSYVPGRRAGSVSFASGGAGDSFVPRSSGLEQSSTVEASAQSSSN